MFSRARRPAILKNEGRQDGKVQDIEGTDGDPDCGSPADFEVDTDAVFPAWKGEHGQGVAAPGNAPVELVLLLGRHSVKQIQRFVGELSRQRVGAKMQSSAGSLILLELLGKSME